MDNLEQIRIIKQKADRLQSMDELPLFEIHILRALGPENINRDNNGRHKTIMIGGVKRNRISGQCQKHAIRESIQSETDYRTRLFPQLVYDQILKDRPSIDRELLEKVILGDAKDETDKKESKKGSKKENTKCAIFNSVQKKHEIIQTKQILDISNIDVKACSEVIEKYLDECKTDFRKIVENSLIDLKKNADQRRVDPLTALMGRMSTEAILGSIPNATQVANAYSVDAAQGDFDDFIVCDEYLNRMGYFLGENESQKTEGAAYLDSTDIGSNVYYQWSCVSTRTLFENLLRGVEEITDAEIENALDKTYEMTELFIKKMISVIPSGSRSSKASHSRPLLTYITKGTLIQPRTFDEAFNKVIIGSEGKSTGEIAVKKFMECVQDTITGAYVEDDYQGRYLLSDIKTLKLPDEVTLCTTKDICKFVRG